MKKLKLEKKITEQKDKLKSYGYQLKNFLPEKFRSRNLVGFVEDSSKTRYAAKFSEKPQLKDEFLMMKNFSHDNIMEASNFIDAEEFYAIIMPIAEGGDLTEVLSSQNLTQTNIQYIMRSIFTALKVIHLAGYIHRDVKPENIFVMGKTINTRIVLADFESMIKDDAPKKYYGTRNYEAPEMLKGEEYDCKVDIWSAGAAMYFFYFFEHPLNHIKDGTVDVNLWSTYEIGEETKNFMKSILTVDPKKRCSAEEALDDPYFSLSLDEIPDFDCCAAINEIDKEIGFTESVELNDIFFNAKKNDDGDENKEKNDGDENKEKNDGDENKEKNDGDENKEKIDGDENKEKNDGDENKEKNDDDENKEKNDGEN